MVIRAIFFCYHDNSSLQSSVSWLCGKWTRRQKGKMSGAEKQRLNTFATACPTLSTNYALKRLSWMCLRCCLCGQLQSHHIYNYGKLWKSFAVIKYKGKQSHGVTYRSTGWWFVWRCQLIQLSTINFILRPSNLSLYPLLLVVTRTKEKWKQAHWMFTKPHSGSKCPKWKLIAFWPSKT